VIALLPGELERPALAAPRSGRAREIVETARRLLEGEGPEALTMRRLAQELEIQAPSLYKHFAGKAVVELAIVEEAMLQMGEVGHEAIHDGDPEFALARLLRVYRVYSFEHANLYRLATQGTLARERMTPGLEEWAGNPWYVVTLDPSLAQALWSFAHGMVMLELDGRYPPGSDLDSTWRAGAAAFELAARRTAETGEP
jgi:AcrR family transcriptional regulator